jgi:hypothetical protein
VSAFAAVPIVEKLFSTKLFVFNHATVRSALAHGHSGPPSLTDTAHAAQKENVTIVRQQGAYSLPSALWGKYIDIVAGISDFPPLKKDLHVSAPAPEVQIGVVPQTIGAQYNFPNGIEKSASGVGLGVIEFGAGEYYDKTDFAVSHGFLPLPPRLGLLRGARQATDGACSTGLRYGHRPHPDPAHLRARPQPPAPGWR